MRLVLSLATLAVLSALAWAWVSGGFDGLATWTAGEQRAFQNSIARALRGARAGEGGAVVALLGACFAYGLAHAAGPGHGKVLLGGYGFARRVPMLRLSVIGMLAAMGQAVTAVALVYFGVLVLGLGRQALVDTTERMMAPVSYAAIALIGVWLLWRGMRRMLRQAESASSEHHHHHDHDAHGYDHAPHAAGEVCSSCGHVHGPTLAQVENASTLREAFALIAGIAIRPCTGALFVLIITWQMGIAGLGIAGAFAMAAGTGLVTVLVGLTAGGMRGGLLASLAGSPRMAQAMAAIDMLAGIAVAFIAGGLFLRAI